MMKIQSTQNESNSPKIGKGILCACAGAISWGFSGTCSQYLFMNYEIDSVWLTAIRMLGAGIILLLSIIPFHSLEIWKLFHSPRDVIQLFLFAMTGLLLCQYAYLTAIQYSNSGTAAVLQEVSIAITSCYVCLRDRKLPTKKLLLCIVMAFTGVFIIATHGNIHTMVLSAGALFWGMGAAIGASAYPLLSEGLVKRWGSPMITGFGLLIGGAFFCIATQSWKRTPDLDNTGILMVIIIILIGTVGAFTLYLIGISILGPVRTKLLGCLEPLSATVISFFWLHSRFTAIDLVGFAFILIMVFIYNTHKKEAVVHHLS